MKNFVMVIILLTALITRASLVSINNHANSDSTRQILPQPGTLDIAADIPGGLGGYPPPGSPPPDINI